jgi:hypothetical protein
LRRAPRVLACALLATMTLSACGASGADPSPTTPPAKATAGPSVSAAAPGDDVDCHSAGGAELVWGGMVAAKDDWAAWYGTQWRHSYAFTITSTIQVVLGPGESWSGQAFYLEEDFEFSSDAENATPKNPIEPEVVRTGTARVFDGYYDADVTFGDIEGEGSSAVLPVTVVQRGVAKGMMERLWSATQDVFFVRGLDAEGNIVINSYQWIFPVDEGTHTFTLPLGGGPTNDEVMNAHPTSAIGTVVSWELAAFQPVLLEDEAAGYVEP